MKPNNLLEMLYRTVQKFPQKDALVWKESGKYQSITYQAFWGRVYHFASGLMWLGIKENDKIAILSNSNPMWGITDFATASMKAVSVPVYPTLPPEQVAYILKNADVRAVVVENEEQRQKVLAGNTNVEYVITMYPGETFYPSEIDVSFSQLEAVGKEYRISDWEAKWRDIDRDQLSTIIHTSGTTGKPNGVMLSHGNFLSNMEAVQFWLIELLSDDIALSYLPLSHVFERMAGYYMPLSVGATIAYAESIDTIKENLKEIRPTVMTSVPRLFEKVYATVRDEIDNGLPIKRRIFNWAVEVGVERYDRYLNTPINKLVLGDGMPKDLRRKWRIADRLVYQKVKKELGGRIRGLVSGGGTLNPDVAKFFWAIDLPIYEGYGLTETSPVITTNPVVRAKVGTVGKVMPNLDVRIAVDGEILVRGPSVMKGYYNNEEATVATFDGDWLCTGDIGELDEDHYLKIIDRKKRIIVLSTGKNVAPQLIENAINESSYVEQSVLIGDHRKYIICLLNPNFEKLLWWAERNGVKSESLEEICQHPSVRDLFKIEIERQTEPFAKFEKPKKVAIIGEEWTVESGELTPKLSTRVKVIENKYKQLIEMIYADEESSDSQEQTEIPVKHG
ncbi:long-chain fatty acid--CoA ligase [Aquibacillus sp. 3ASR75-11]|uniref:Acyl-CoA synthetase n=1 Tax=Terrihalobacillus insolitus TaxID=2950438 RepID=A0A9X3WUD3_9BACI|nr:long-chain fatty acid--CoA ligase [Terrihalobacillus insolitus]MDC3414563.1 long-chain fatty acid--CoA ligase [Terrihalobacillus insolitus]MDC3425760.1 long-chain fatty acid--CoA ligase [Terrihalobacillus insolitus]